MIPQHCPFDYCLSGELNFSLADPDAQCNRNRSGILCGKCKPGYSLTLGTNECKHCTNIYLLLLVPFTLAGVLLIVFLSLTDMTVTAGTINGLLFFANIVRENQATFFPAQTTETFLSVFIAWLNLDLVMQRCSRKRQLWCPGSNRRGSEPVAGGRKGEWQAVIDVVAGQWSCSHLRSPKDAVR